MHCKQVDPAAFPVSAVADLYPNDPSPSFQPTLDYGAERRMASVEQAIQLRSVPEDTKIDSRAEADEDGFHGSESEQARAAALERRDGTTVHAHSKRQRRLGESLTDAEAARDPTKPFRVHPRIITSQLLPAAYPRLTDGRPTMECMPEGDTIFRTAEVLRAALLGRRITAARAQAQRGLRSVPDLSRLIGATVASVDARGKHLLIGFDNGLHLRSHLRMSGSWHRYRPGEPWRRPRQQASAILETAESVAVAFNTPVVELLTDADLRRSRALSTLGPDLLGRFFDADEALRRLRERSAEEVGNALLDQRAVAGIGNVYKSEVAFLEAMDPWASVGAFEDGELQAALRTARRLLQANTRGGARVTTASAVRGQGLWVYGRAGRPCRRCGTPIQVRRQGELSRLTYWCPHCQPPRGS